MSTLHFSDDGHLGAPVVAQAELEERIRQLGKSISADYEGRNPLLVCVLKGAFMFLADLAKAISMPVDFDFMAVASYGASSKTSGVVRIVKDLDIDLAGRDVLLVEDIIDSGLTLSYLRKHLSTRNPRSLEVCALLVKEGARVADGDLRYVGFHIPRTFVVGYGLDLGERYRNLSYIAAYRDDVPNADG